MSMTYHDYNRDRIGWFFGLSGWQLAVLAADRAAGVPLSAARRLVGGAAVHPRLGAGHDHHRGPGPGPLGHRLVPRLRVVRGRRADRLDPVAQPGHRAGRVAEPAEADLPGVLQGVEVHDGPPHGPALTRVAIIQNHATKTWAVTAMVVHPGIGMRDGDERTRQGQGLTELLDLAVADRADRRGAVRGPHRARRRRRTGPVDRTAPAARRAPAVPAGQRRPPTRPDLGVGAHRSVRHRGRPRGPDRDGRPGNPAAAWTAAPGCCTG